MLSDTREAMLYLDKIKAWGGTHLDLYAELRRIDAETLRDTVLADFGLDGKGEKVYDLGGNTVTVSLAQDLTLRIFDGNARKVVKSIPKKGADEAKHAAAKADFGDLKKNVKKVVKARCDLLFQHFLKGKGWRADDWKNAYMGENFPAAADGQPAGLEPGRQDLYPPGRRGHRQRGAVLYRGQQANPGGPPHGDGAGGRAGMAEVL